MPGSDTFSRSIPLLEQALSLFEGGELDQAERLYRDVLRIEPAHVVALNGLGRVFMLQKRAEQAVEVFERATLHDPAEAVLHKNLGAALCSMGRLEESFAAFRTYAMLVDVGSSSSRMAPHKSRHDAEQQAFLNASACQYLSRGGFHIAEAARVQGSAINPECIPAALSDSWKASAQMVLDHFLTGSALQRLRAFCWGSTIWNRVYENGYLGASAEHGFGSPLLAQIIEELQRLLHPVLGGLPLVQLWAFKYDGAMKGVGLHADCAAVNVNFWITPDDANLDPAGGGLVIWDAPVPADWDFQTYNQDEAAARAFLESRGAKAITVPYRCNRAVVFDSSLFHETDRLAFKDGYLNRRINITLLFGQR